MTNLHNLKTTSVLLRPHGVIITHSAARGIEPPIATGAAGITADMALKGRTGRLCANKESPHGRGTHDNIG